MPCSRVSPQSWTLPARAGIRTHNLGLPQVSSQTLYPLGHDCPVENSLVSVDLSGASSYNYACNKLILIVLIRNAKTQYAKITVNKPFVKLIGLNVYSLWGSFDKQGKLARELNSKTAPMGGEISAGDLLTMNAQIKHRCNISFTYQPM